MSTFTREKLAKIAEHEAHLNLVWTPGGCEADKYKEAYFGKPANFGKGKWSWCAAFVTWCTREAGLDTPIMAPSRFGYTFALVEAWQQWAIEKGFYHDNDGKFKPEAGDIVCFDWDQVSIDQKDNDWENHIGIHLHTLSDGNHACGEGNAGNMTAVKIRKPIQVQGWIRIPDGYSFSGKVEMPVSPVSPVPEVEIPKSEMPVSPVSDAFEIAFQRNLKKEGGYTDHPDDKGGPTNLGVTMGRLSDYLGRPATRTDVKNLTVSDARKIYKIYYWDAMNLDLVTKQSISTLLFDQGVNRGTVTAVKDMQITLNRYFGISLVQDGKLGQKTADAIMKVDTTKLIVFYVADSQDKYAAIVKKNPSQVVFLAGWLNRTQALLELIWG